jgi:centlein
MNLISNEFCNLSNLNNYLNNSLLYTNTNNNNDSTIVSTTSNEADLINTLQLKCKHLEEELSNTQADKEFVWSLWRQLQTTNPDLTNAIAYAIQREKERNEQKDQKVLEILQIKDKNIEKLSAICNQKETEIQKLTDQIKDLELKLLSQEDELKCSRLNLKTQSDKELMYEQMLRLRDEKLDSFLRENESLNTKLNEYIKEKDLFMNKSQDFKNKATFYKSELDRAHSTSEKLAQELKNLTQQLEKTKSESNSKQEFLNEQEKIIKQLRLIHVDLQNALKVEKETQNILQNECDSLKSMYHDKMRFKEKCYNDLIKNHQNEIKEYNAKIDALKLRLAHRKEVLNEVEVKKFKEEGIQSDIIVQPSKSDEAQISRLNKDLFKLRDENFKLKRDLCNLKVKLSNTHQIKVKFKKKKIPILRNRKTEIAAAQKANAVENSDSSIKYIQLCNKLAEEYRVLYVKYIKLRRMEIKFSSKRLSSKRLKKKKVKNNNKEIRKIIVREDENLISKCADLKTQCDNLTQSKLKLDLLLKTFSFDLSTQLNMNKTLKQENGTLLSRIKSCEEKSCHLERDLKHKRLLIESLKNKMQEIQESKENKSQNEADLNSQLNDLKNQLKSMQISALESKKRIKVGQQSVLIVIGILAD